MEPAATSEEAEALLAELVERGLLPAGSAEWTRDVSVETGTEMARVLVAAGLVDRREVYRVLAARWGLEWVDLVAEEPDADLLAGLDPAVLAAEGWVPLRRLPGGEVRVATATRPDEAWRSRVGEIVGGPVVAAATTDWDVVQALQGWYRDLLADRASYGLWRRAPEQSARQVLVRRQAVVILAVSALVITSFVLAPSTTLAFLILLGSLAFLASITFKFAVSLHGTRAERDVGVTAAPPFCVPKRVP